MLDNLKITSALLSRFDLIFLLTEDYSSRLTSYVMKTMTGKRRTNQF
jgi:DNA replicative helicase MCM subunit Mcm2 (Cdc46/Mcm family)